MGRVFLQKESSEENSHGRKRRVEQWHQLPRSYRCFWKGSTGRRPVPSYDPQMAV
jgi:hypothetical protein